MSTAPITAEPVLVLPHCPCDKPMPQFTKMSIGRQKKKKKKTKCITEKLVALEVRLQWA
jgi:hypothetical protein